MSNEPEVVIYGLLDMQLCVPKHYTDEQVVECAERLNPSGTQNGWQIRKMGDVLLGGDPERKECCDREGFVHIMLDA